MTERKVLTLWQPWASLVTVGAKMVETRPWSTKYRGTLYIHAAAKPMKDEAAALWWSQSDTLQSQIDSEHWEPIHYGKVLARCQLVDVVPTELICWLDSPERVDGAPLDPAGNGWGSPGPSWRKIWVMEHDEEPGTFVNKREQPFGNFAPERFAWLLDEIEPLEPVPVKGGQRIWNWRGEW